MAAGQSAQTGWWQGARIYELYIDKFAGDIRGLIARLDYFAELGIDALHILPHYPSPMVDDGYDVSMYRGVRPELGTLDDFRTLLAETEARGIKVIIDFPINHVSSEHPWFQEARASTDNPKRDYFLWSDSGKEFADALNPFVDMKPSNWVWNSATEDYYYATFYPQQPDLNWDNPHVYEAMLGHMEFWADLGVDGFRLDAIGYLIKRDGTLCRGLPETHDLIKRIRARLDDRYGGRVVLIAEMHQPLPEMLPYFGAGDECHLVYDFPMAEQLFLALVRGDDAPVRALLERSKDIPPGCAWLFFLRNHDDLSLITLAAHDRDELRRVLDPDDEYPFNAGACVSVRLATGCGGDERLILDAFRKLYALPGAHVLYYGDEIGMRNLPLEEGVIDTRHYVRGAFDWRVADHMRRDPDSLLSRVAAIIRTS